MTCTRLAQGPHSLPFSACKTDEGHTVIHWRLNKLFAILSIHGAGAGMGILLPPPEHQQQRVAGGCEQGQSACHQRGYAAGRWCRKGPGSAGQGAEGAVPLTVSACVHCMVKVKETLHRHRYQVETKGRELGSAKIQEDARPDALQQKHTSTLCGTACRRSNVL